MEDCTHTSSQQETPPSQEAQDAPEGLEGRNQEAYAEIDFDREFVGSFARHAEDFVGRSRKVRRTIVGFAERHSHLPQITHFVSEQGEQEGLYASIFMRRDRLWHIYDLASRTWSKTLSLHLEHDELVDAARKAYATADPDDQKAKHQAIKAAILPILHSTLMGDVDTYNKALTTASNAMVDASAEGTAAATALNAQYNGKRVPAMATTAETASTRLRQASSYWPNGQSVLDDQVSGLAGDLAPSLTVHLDNGDTPAQMTNTTEKILGVGAGAAFYMDQHIQATIILAMLVFYRAQKVVELDWVTMGDERVCPQCEDLEDAGPYKLQEVPMPPAHGGCRCILTIA